jgi:hypothetical protein
LYTVSDVGTRRLGQYLSRQQLFRLATVPVEVLEYFYQSKDRMFGIPDVPMLMKFQVIGCKFIVSDWIDQSTITYPTTIKLLWSSIIPNDAKCFIYADKFRMCGWEGCYNCS